MYLHLHPFDNSWHLLPRAVGQPDIVYAVLQVLESFPTSRALPKKFFGGHISIVVFVVRDFKDEFIDLYAIDVPGARW
jgi:hypothetical protein